MSSAHRPTWDPAKGRADERHKSARVSAREMPSHTKLKFRQAQPAVSGSTGRRADDVRRDLKRELELAEREHVNQKRKERGLAPLTGDVGSSGSVNAPDGQQEDELTERRRMIERLKELDEDEDASDEDRPGQDPEDKVDSGSLSDSSASESNDDDDDDDDDDETAALLRELEKIKRERAEEKARQEQERTEMTEMSREEEIALGNPLLNLENALRRDGRAGSGGGSGTEASTASARESGGFGVKRRWDDDVIFKNQASGNEGGSSKSGFVNDLTRSEFHKRFMQRYVQ